MSKVINHALLKAAKIVSETALRNRKLKIVLSEEFGKNKVTVHGHRGTAYGWVTVKIAILPQSIEDRKRLEDRVWKLISDHNISIGSFGTPGDMGSDYGWGRNIHINFLSPVSWAPEVMVRGEKSWAGNALRFRTKEEAEANVANLMCRWLLVEDTRVVPSTDPITYAWVDGALVNLESGHAHVPPMSVSL